MVTRPARGASRTRNGFSTVETTPTPLRALAPTLRGPRSRVGVRQKASKDESREHGATAGLIAIGLVPVVRAMEFCKLAPRCNGARPFEG